MYQDGLSFTAEVAEVQCESAADTKRVLYFIPYRTYMKVVKIVDSQYMITISLY